MAEKVIPITLEMFNPKDRSARTNRQLARFMAEFFGRGCLRLHRAMRSGRPLPAVTAEEVDEAVFASIRQIYGLPDQTDPQEFYLQQHRQGRGVMEYLGRLFPEVAGEIELKDEVTYFSDRPSDLFKLISRPSDRIDPVLAYELQRHVLFAHISGLSNARNLRIRAQSFLAGFQGLFNDKLFEGLEGAGDKYVLETVHDDETNEVIGFRDDMRTIPPTAHLKRIPEMVRSIPEIGLVRTKPRKKDDGNVVIKALVKALSNGGEIGIESVQDSIGMMFCLTDPHSSVEKLTDTVLEVLKSGPRKIVTINRRDQVRGNRGQSPKFNFTRLEVQFEDMPTFFELVFRTAEQHVNSLLAVGKRDSKGNFDGEAHLLYEARRASRILPIIIPKEVYDRDPDKPMDLDRVIVNRMKHIADDLRGRHRVWH